MKKLLYFLSVLLVVFFGCTETINQTNPIQTSKKELIPIPPESSFNTETEYSVTKTINGSSGGTMVLHNTYVSSSGHTVTINAVLQIPKGAFEGTTDITLTTDDYYAAVSFNPHMTFAIPLNLNLSFSGLNLNSLHINPQHVDFCYIEEDEDGNGDAEHINYQNLYVNLNAGLVSVTGAQLNHFSRYGFVR